MRYELEYIDKEWYEKNHDLLAEAFAEVGDGRSLDPSFETYRAMMNDFTSFVAMAYTDEGDAVGVLMVAISRARHANFYVATNDLIYLRPQYRNTGAGAHLFKMAEDIARERGADVFYWAMPVGTPLDKALARRKKLYPIFEHVYRRRLDE